MNRAFVSPQTRPVVAYCFPTELMLSLRPPPRRPFPPPEGPGRAERGCAARPDLTSARLSSARHSLACGRPEVAGAGPAECVWLAGPGCLTDAVLETGAACRISSLLQAAAGSIFSPPAPMG